MLTILIFSLLAQAAIREHGADPGPKKPCRRAEMNSCIEGHRARMNEELANISSVDDKLRLIAADQESFRHERVSLENESRAARVTAEMAEKEISDGENLSSETPVFPAGPAPGEIFFLKGEPNSWEELHSAERKDRLNTLANSSRSRIAQIDPLHRNLAMEIAALAEAGASLNRERIQHGQQVNVHAGMCESGCQQQFCPYE